MTTILILFILLTQVACQAADPINTIDTFSCDNGNNRVSGNEGFLEIIQNGTCSFLWQDGTDLFGIRTDNLALQDGDNFTLAATEEMKPKTYQPPLDAGYFISGHKEPVLKFNFKNYRNGTIKIPFFRNQLYLNINGDINNYFEITPVKLTKFSLSFKKTVKESIHLELVGAIIDETSLNHRLISEDSLTIPITFKDDRVVKVKTSRAHPNCSNIFYDVNETVHEIKGPEPSAEEIKYRCVSIFKSKDLHFDVDFANFIELVDQDDELLLDNGSPQEKIHVVKPEDQQTLNTLSFTGHELAVIYNSPRKVDPAKNMQFNLRVQSKAQGGLVLNPTVLNLIGDGGQVRFVLRPNPKEYSAVLVKNAVKLQQTNITITSGLRVLANFYESSFLPPIIVNDEPSTDLIVEITSKSLKTLNNVLEFVNLNSSCHKTFPRSFGSLNVVSNQACHFTIASSEPVSLDFNYHDGGCVKIQSLELGKPLYERCNLSIAEAIPTFVLKKALVTVNLTSSGTLFDASLSPYRYKTSSSLQLTSEVNITSALYPSYPKLHENQILSLNGTNQSYVFSINDADIRTGEKLILNQIDINRTRDDVIASNIISNLTLDITSSTDYQLHRGYSLTARRYDSIISADMSKNQLMTSKNISSAYIKISAKGYRIEYTISYNSTKVVSKNFEVKLFESRSTRNSAKFNQSELMPISSSTTSDTLLILYKTIKGDSDLPQIKLNYNRIPCNKTDHFCDDSTRCVPSEWLCKGVQYCNDLSDIRRCGPAGTQPNPNVITGFNGATVFILLILVYALGCVTVKYGPNVYKNLEGRFRSGQYTAFSSVE